MIKNKLFFLIILATLLSSFIHYSKTYRVASSLDPKWIVDDNCGASNPHRGWQTYRDLDCNLSYFSNNNYDIPSEVFYSRFLISEFDFEYNTLSDTWEFDFSIINDKIDEAVAFGSNYSFRIYFWGLFRNPSQVANGFLGASEKIKEYCEDYESYTWCQDMTMEAQKKSGGTYRQEWIANFDSPAMLKFHQDLIKQLGSTYDGHPSIDYIDVGSVGNFGEWHCGGVQVRDEDDEFVNVEPDLFINHNPPYMEDIIGHYFANFEETPLVMQIGGWVAKRTIERLDFVYEVLGRRDFGIRGDGLADTGPLGGSYHFSTSRSHTVYDSVFNTPNWDGSDIDFGIPRYHDQWARGPIIFEVAHSGYLQWLHHEYVGDPSLKDLYVQEIIDYVSNYHLSIMNLKNSYMPGINCPTTGGYWGDHRWTNAGFDPAHIPDAEIRIAETLPHFLNALGYKIRLNWADVPPDAHMMYEEIHNDRFTQFDINFESSNTGVAPCYYDYFWAVKVVYEPTYDPSICGVGEVVNSSLSIKARLPGEPSFYPEKIEVKIDDPTPGPYKVFLGLTKEGEDEARIWLENCEYDATEDCRWYDVGTIMIH